MLPGKSLKMLDGSISLITRPDLHSQLRPMREQLVITDICNKHSNLHAMPQHNKDEVRIVSIKFKVWSCS